MNLKNILLLGNGKIGSAVYKYLLQNNDLSVTTVDLPGRMADITLDLTQSNTLYNLINSREDDLVVNCLPAKCNKIVDICLDAGINIVDTAFVENDDFLDIENKKALSNKIFCLHDIGFAPGLPNYIVGAYLRRPEDVLDNVRIFAGGITKHRNSNKYGYVVTWSIDDLLSEFIRPARFKENNRILALDPLEAPIELVEAGDFILEGIPTDGVRSMMFDARIKSICEKTLRWPDTFNLIKQLIKLNTFQYNMRKICSDSSVEDMVVLRVDVDHIRHDMVVYGNNEMTAMERVTAGTCASVVETLEKQDIAPGKYTLKDINGQFREKLDSKLRQKGLNIHIRGKKSG